MNISEIGNVILVVVAVGGLMLSLWQFYVARQDKRLGLHAHISNGFLTFGPELSDVMLFFEIANSGDKTAHIVGIKVAWGKVTLLFPKGIEGTHNLPFDLPSGRSAKFWTPLKDFAKTMQENGAPKRRVNVKACFIDDVGKSYYSKNFTIDIKEWVKD